MSKLTIAGFTNIGYRLHSRSYSPIEADLSGRTVVITGATGGLGLATARQLAAMGARVAVVGRDQAKLDTVIRENGGNLTGYRAELSLLEEVRRLGGEILESEPSIDVLINNVGVLLPDREMTEEGLEKTFAINLAGHFLLTNLLTPRIIESAPARIINVTSGGMYSEKIRPDDLQFDDDPYRGTASYARTKRAQVVLTEMWAERLQGNGVVVHSMHPGWAGTDGVAESLPTFNKVMKPLLRTPEEGADTIVWLAAACEPAQSTGRFWFDRREAPTHLTDSTRESAKERMELWRRLAEITGSDLDPSLAKGH